VSNEQDVIEILEQDHREVEEMFRELESLRGAASDEQRERRKSLTEQVTIELVRHSVAEEVLVYPKVEKQVSAEEAEHAREEHAEAEENEEFDAVIAGCDVARRKELGDRLEAIQVFAPTHPHPSTAGNPVAQALTGPFVAMVDRVRDALSG